MDEEEKPVTETDVTNLLNVNFDISQSKNLFAIYLSGLFILAYALSILVAMLHLRTESVVYALTRPQPDSFFAEYIIMVRTSQYIGSSFDPRGRIQIQLKGSFSDSPLLHLKKGKGMEYFLERGTTNIFVYHSPSVLGDIEQIEISLVNDAPNEIPYVTWRPSYLSVMHPVSKNWWGCVINQQLKCNDVFVESYDCAARIRDTHSILESLCTFHLWFSLFNNPQRFGMYNNLVNVIVIFFIISTLMTATMVEELLKGLFPRGSFLLGFTQQKMYSIGLPAVLALVLEMFIEAIFRNTIPRASAIEYNMFQGLVKPVIATFELRDFIVNYNWEKVSCLIPLKTVIVPYGSRHPSAMSVFNVEPHLSFFNIWGRLGIDVGRFGNWYLRSVSIGALSLPISIKWLGIEAKSRKEDMLVRQYISNFTNPMCYFCCWLVDWPLHFFDEPNQAWLIISHIICTDILSLSKLKKEEYVACLAQICVHQWHGLICCIFLKVVKQSFDNKGFSVSGVSSLISSKLTRFGRRSAREIQATWRQRQLHLTEMNLKRAQSVVTQDQEMDENESSVLLNRNKSVGINKEIESTICLNCMSKKENSEDSDEENEFAFIGEDFNDDYTEDFLDFDVIFSPKNKPKPKSPEEIGDKRPKKNYLKITAARTSLSQMPEFSIVQETKAKPQSRKKRSKKNRRLKSYAGSPELIGIDNVRFNDVTGDMYTDVDVKPDASGFGDSRDLGDYLGLGVNNNNRNADTNMNADDDDFVSETSYIPESAIHHQQQTSILRKIFEQKQSKKLTVDKERVSLPVATYENYQLGPPFDGSYAVERDPDNRFRYLRHANEILAYCCDNTRCRAFCDIHKMVGATSFEILRKLLKDILYFAMDSESVKSSQKILKRKNMMYNLYDYMKNKAELYEDEMFKSSSYVEYDGTFCNQMLTSLLTTVEFILDFTINIRKDGKARYIKKKETLYGRVTHQTQRCLFCAKYLAPGVTTNDTGCYDLEVLVRFFMNATVAVAQKEINIEMTYKYTVQRFCANIVSNAMKEVSVELDDPPLVLACKVTRAMICTQLDKMLPKITSFKDMTADELRRVGSRRERIQARHDPTAGGNKIETEAGKRKKYIISNLQDQLGTKWRSGLKENELEYCSKLLAQILVHEKIMGFSVYNGFLLKEHEDILAGNKLRLIEIERKAHSAVKKIVRFMILPSLRKALGDSHAVDVLFCSPDVEVSYLQETISVMQLNSEVTFLKTCCYYIDDIVIAKIEEFRYFAVYLTTFDPSVNLSDKLKASMFARSYKIDDQIELQIMNNNSSLIAAPVLRWGFSAIKGYALPKELKMLPHVDKHFKEKYQAASKSLPEGSKKQQIAAKLVKTRLKVKSYLDGQKLKKNKELRIHLAHVQAQITEQIALLAQTVTSAFSLEADYQREYSNDDLFNVEFYATKNLKLLFPTNVGFILLFLLVILTLVMIMLTTFNGGSLPVPSVQSWFLRFVQALLLYGFVFEPIKCLTYVLLQVYTG